MTGFFCLIDPSGYEAARAANSQWTPIRLRMAQIRTDDNALPEIIVAAVMLWWCVAMMVLRYFPECTTTNYGYLLRYVNPVHWGTIGGLIGVGHLVGLIGLWHKVRVACGLLGLAFFFFVVTTVFDVGGLNTGVGVYAILAATEFAILWRLAGR